jgi:hypothetical protein
LPRPGRRIAGKPTKKPCPTPKTASALREAIADRYT